MILGNRHLWRDLRRKGGFTLIEILVVVAIIALMVAILIPTLQRAREQARIVKCLANTSSFAKAVLSFSSEHRGYGQIVARGYDNNLNILPAGPDWDTVDPDHTRYAYQTGLKMGTLNTSIAFLKAWPVAYGPHLGQVGLKRMEQYLDASASSDPAYYTRKFGPREVFLCPSDKYPVRDMWSPGMMFGLLSYATNEDVFGISTGAWREGEPHPTDAPRLQGRLEKIIRPSEVGLFSDGGFEDKPGGRILLVTWGNMNGPFIQNFERVANRLPQRRHSLDGGINVGFADGSGRYVKPLAWVWKDGRRYVKTYTPTVRVSPYNVGDVRSEQP